LVLVASLVNQTCTSSPGWSFFLIEFSTPTYTHIVIGTVVGLIVTNNQCSILISGATERYTPSCRYEYLTVWSLPFIN